MAIIFDVGFKADARGLSQSLGPQLATIKSEIQEAFNSVPRAGGMQQSLQKAVHQAQILENTLRRATTDKGISMVSLNAGLAKAGTTATQLITTLGMAGPEFAGSFNVALTSLATANTRAITLGSKLKEAAHVFTQNFKYSFAASTYQSLTKSLSEAVAWAKDLNKELTTISIVSGKTGASLDAVFESVVNGANKLGIAAKDYAQASTIFYQQGLGTKEVERRSDITIKAAKAAGASVSEMSSQLTAVWNTYRMQGDELERAASIGAKLAASTAVEFNDIAEAMQYSATAASQMGVSYESLAAMISTVGDTTQQSASIVGNAFKTIFSRFEQLKTEGTDGEVTLGRVSKQLKDLGVDVLDSSGELMKLDTVIQNVGQNWDKYSQKQQLAIAQAVGGTRQYAQFLALMQNFDKYQKLRGIAEKEGTGALESQYKSYQEGIEAAAISASEAWKQAFGNIFTEDTIKDFYEFLEDAGDLVGYLLQGLGGIEGIIKLIGAYLIRYIQPFGASAIAGIKTMRDGLSPVEKQVQNIATEANVMRASMGVAPTSLNTAAASKQQQQQMNALYASYQNNPLESISQNIGLQKINIWEKVKSSMVEVNRLLNSNNELEKLNGEYLKNQLAGRQDSLNIALDNAEAAERLLQHLQRQLDLEERIRQAQLREDAATGEGSKIEEMANDINQQISPLASNGQLPNTNFINQSLSNILDIGPVNSSMTTDQIANLSHEFSNLQISIELAKKEMINAGEDTSGLNTYQQAVQKIRAALEEYSAQLERTKAAQQEFVNEGAKASQILLNGFNKLKVSDKDLFNLDPKAMSKDFNSMIKELEDIGALTKDVFQIDTDASLNDIYDAYDGLAEYISQDADLMERMKLDPSFMQQLKTVTGTFEETVTQALNLKNTISNLPTGALTQLNQLLTQTTGQIINSQLQMASSGLMTLQMFSPVINEIARGFAGLSIDAEQFYSSLTMSLPMIIMMWPTLAKIFSSFKDGLILLTTMKGINEANLATNAAALGVENLRNILKKAGVQYDEKATAEELAQLAIDKKVLTIETLKNAMTKSWLLLLSGGLILIMGIIGVVMAANKAIKESITKDAENAQKRLDELKESQQAIEDNTKAVEENVAAWQAAKKTGINATEAYDNMTKSLTELNKALIASGINSERLNSAMTRAIAIGDMSEYNQLLKDAQKNYKANLIQQTAATNAKIMRDAQSGENAVEGAGAGVLAKYNFKGNTQGVVAFRQEYQKLQQSLNQAKMKQAALDPKKDQAEWEKYQKIIENTTEKIGSLSEVYDKVTENSEAAAAILQQQVTDIANSMGNGNSIEDLKELYSAVHSAGIEANMTTEEIDNMFRTAISGNRELNILMAGSDQLREKQMTMLTKKAKESQNTLQLIEQFKQAYALDPNGVQTDLLAKQLSAVNEEMKAYYEINKAQGLNAALSYGGQLSNMVDNLRNSAQETTEVFQQIQDAYNKLSIDNKEILVETGIDLVTTPDDLQSIINNWKDLKADLKVEIINKEELLADIEADNTLQDGLSDAVEQYTEKGYITDDLAKELIDSGYGEYLTTVGDKIVLNTKAQEDWNKSLDDEHQKLRQYLQEETNFSQVGAQMAKDMVALAGLADSENPFVKFGKSVQDMSKEFANGSASVQDLQKYLYNISTEVDSLNKMDSIKLFDTDDMSGDIEKVQKAMEGVGSAISDAMNAAAKAFNNGRISLQDYVKVLQKANNTAVKMVNTTQKTIKAKQESIEAQKDENEGIKNNTKDTTKATDTSKKFTAEKQKQVNELKNLSTGLEKTHANLIDQQIRLKAAADFTDSLTQNYNTLKQVLNNDFTPKVDISSWTQTQRQALIELGWAAENSLSELAKTGDAEAKELGEQIKVQTIKLMDGLKENDAEAFNELTRLVGLANAKHIESLNNAEASITEGLNQMGEALKSLSSISVTISMSGSLGLDPPSGLDIAKAIALGTPIYAKPTDNKLTISATATGDTKKFLEGAGNFLSGLAKKRVAESKIEDKGLENGNPNPYSNYRGPATGPFKVNEGKDGNKTGGGGKGGGGGSDKADKEPKSYDPMDSYDYDDSNFEGYIENFFNIEQSLKSIETALTAIDDADALFVGNSRLAMYKKKNDLLIKQGKAYRNLRNQALSNFDYNINQLSAQDPTIARMLKEGIKVDESGFKTITNYEEILAYLNSMAESANAAQNNQIIDKNLELHMLNSELQSGVTEERKKEIDARKKQLDKEVNSGEESVKASKERIDALKTLLDNANSDRDKAIESALGAKQAVYQMIDNKMQEIEENYSLKIEVREADIARLENIAELLGESSSVAKDLANIYYQQFKRNKDIAQTYSDQADRYLEVFNNLNPGSEHWKWFEEKYGADVWNEAIANGTAYSLIQEPLRETITSLSDSIVTIQENLTSAWEKIYTVYEDYLDKWDKISSQTELLASKTELFEKIFEVFGESTIDLDTYGEILVNKTKQAANEIKLAQTKLDGLQKTEEFFQKQLDQAEINGLTPAMINSIKESLKEATDAVLEGQKDLYSAMQDYVDTIKEAEEEYAEQLKKHFGEDIGNFLDFGTAKDQFDQLAQIRDRYLDDFDKDYYLNKYERDIKKQIESISDPSRLNSYNKLLADINNKRKSGVQLTKYEAEYLEKQIELEKAKDELTNARQSKNSMRLSRDASGNYSYIYSANSEAAIEDALQKVEDAEKNLRDFNIQWQQDYENQWLEIQAQWQDFINEVDQNRYQTDASYREYIDGQMKYYQEQSDYYGKQLELVNNNLGQSFRQTALGILTDCNEMEAAQNRWVNANIKNFETLKNTHLEFYNMAKEELDKYGYVINNMSQGVSKDLDVIDKEMATLTQSAINMSQETINILNGENGLGEQFKTFSRMAQDAINDLIEKLKELEDMEERLDLEYGIADKIGDTTLEEETKSPSYLSSSGWKTTKNWLENNKDYYVQNGGTLAEVKFPSGISGQIKGKATNNGLELFVDAYGKTLTSKDWDLYYEITQELKRIFGNSISGRYTNYSGQLQKFASGGYTGNIGTKGIDSIPAMLSPGEYVLNPTDTENLLSAVHMANTIVPRAISTLSNLSSFGTIDDKTLGIEQDVKIEAVFPNVSVASEIEAAFNDLINQTAQYINKKY